MWWIPAVSVRLPAQCVVPCASLRFIQGHVGGFTDIFFFLFFFFGGGGENLWSLHLYLLEIFFAISDCVLCKGVKASSEQGTDHFQIFLPQGHRDNKILLGVLKSLSLLFQGDLLWTTLNARRTALLPGLLMSWQSHQNIDLLHPYVRWKVWYSPGGGKRNNNETKDQLIALHLLTGMKTPWVILEQRPGGLLFPVLYWSGPRLYQSSSPAYGFTSYLLSHVE